MGNSGDGDVLVLRAQRVWFLSSENGSRKAELPMLMVCVYELKLTLFLNLETIDEHRQMHHNFFTNVCASGQNQGPPASH